MTLAPVKPGGWDPEDELTSDEMNALQAELVKAIDGEGGGSYVLLSALIFAGSEVQFTTARVRPGGVLTVSAAGKIDVLSSGLLEVEPGGVARLKSPPGLSGGGKLDVQKGALVEVASGGILRIKGGPDGGGFDIEAGAAMGVSGVVSVFGDVDVKSGGEVNVQAGARIDIEPASGPTPGGRINVLSGGKILGSDGAEIQVFESADLTINSSLATFRITLVPIHVSVTGGVPDYQPATKGIPTWEMHDATNNGWIAFAVPLRPGDVLTTLRLTLIGGAHGGVSPAAMPRFQLVEMALDGTQNLVATADDPVTGAAYASSHSVTLSFGAGHPVVGDLLFCRVRTEGGANAIADRTVITAIDGTLNAKSFRGPQEVYG